MLLLLAPVSGASHSLLEPHGGIPDLVAYTHSPGALDETKTPTLCGNVLNVGPESIVATPFYVELLLNDESTKSTLITQRLYYGEGVKVCFTLDEPLPRGFHRFTLVADSEREVPESDEENNVANPERLYVSSTPLPDLRVREFQVFPRVATPGRMQTFYVEVQNAGRGASNDTMGEMGDDRGPLGRFRIPSLEPGATYREGFVVPHGLRPPGNFTAMATLDVLDAVRELDEGNNVAQYLYEIPVQPMPDLAVTAASVNGTLVAYRGIRVDAILGNVGERPAYRPTLVLKLGDAVLGNATRGSLAAGANFTAQFHFVLPAGTHQLRLVADPAGTLTEMDEANNVRLLNVTVAVSPEDLAQPNLLVQDLDAMPNDPAPGEPVGLTALVHNAGGKTSNATQVTFYADGALLGRKTLTAIKPNSYATVTFAWGRATEGDHDLRAFVDPDNLVAEADERDNNFTTFVSFLPPVPRTSPPANDTTAPPAETPPPGGEGGGATPPPDGQSGTGGQTDPPRKPSTPEVALGELSVRTVQVPGGLRGVVVAALRNPTLDPLPSMTVTFYVDGEKLVEKLVSPIPAAGTASATTGEVGLPEGKHTIRAEVRILGTDLPPVVRESEYEKAAGEKGVPGFEAALLVVAVALLAFASRRR